MTFTLHTKQIHTAQQKGPLPQEANSRSLLNDRYHKKEISKPYFKIENGGSDFICTVKCKILETDQEYVGKGCETSKSKAKESAARNLLGNISI